MTLHWEPNTPRFMVETQLKPRGILNPAVLLAMGQVQRERFVPEAYQHLAYSDSALPIDCQQTISQPYIVALMTELLQIKAGDKVLEVGTGSGYQTAVLAAIGAEVFTIEVHAKLLEQAQSVLGGLGLNATFRLGDGHLGWPEHGPFDAILVAAAPTEVPPLLLEQIKAGGRLVIPVGPAEDQHLLLFEKGTTGHIHYKEVMPVRFVPLIQV